MKAEIQLRTIAMDSWASLEHQLRYKKDRELDEEEQAELRYCADLSQELDARMGELKRKVFVEGNGEIQTLLQELKDYSKRGE